MLKILTLLCMLSSFCNFIRDDFYISGSMVFSYSGIIYKLRCDVNWSICILGLLRGYILMGECSSPRPVSQLLLYLDMVSRQRGEKSLLWFLVSQPSGLLLFHSGRSNYSLLFQISFHFINNILFTC